MQWSVKELVLATAGQLLCGDEGLMFNGVGIDSRTIDPHMAFVALCGENHDGHAFIDQVIADGVRGTIVQKDAIDARKLEELKAEGIACIAVADTLTALGAVATHQRSQFDIPLVAITGSSGKTTTRQLTAGVMMQKYRLLTTQGNLNNEIGVPLTLFNLETTHQAAVLELGMNHAGEIDRLAAICRPTIGMITNVGPAHLEFLESLDGVARAKAELLPHIDPGGHAVLNLDDPLVAQMATRAVCQVTYFGCHKDADVRAEEIVTGSQGTAFVLALPSDRVPVRLTVPGRFMVANALAAAAVGYLAGVPAEQIKAGLEAFQPAKGRLEALKLANGVHVINDTYNANPDSMAVAFESFAVRRGPKRGFIVLGDMLELGDQAPSLHRQVGEMAASYKPCKLYAFGDHAHNVMEGAREGGMAGADLFTGSKAEIGAKLLRQLEPGDWILVKGSRGMAMETVVDAIRTGSSTISDD